MTISNPIESVEICHNTQHRKRWAAIEMHKIVQETYQPGATVSYVSRKHGIPPSQLFYWRKVLESGALTGVKTEEELVPMSKVNDLKKTYQTTRTCAWPEEQKCQTWTRKKTYKYTASYTRHLSSSDTHSVFINHEGCQALIPVTPNCKS